jgi:hypothetical protein
MFPFLLKSYAGACSPLYSIVMYMCSGMYLDLEKKSLMEEKKKK